ncbi:MAG: alpha-ketoacid dehydrogenase subunit beta [Candidatus Bathyarchaeia archaeon]
MVEERELTLVEAINESLRQEMQRDPNIIIMGEDVATYGGVFGATSGLLKEFGPERVRDTPISEAGFVGTATGMAATGLRPVVELMFIDFFGVAMDQIYNQAAKLRYMCGGGINVPMVIRATIGAGWSAAAQHSQSLYSIFAHVPGLKVAIPSTPWDGKGLLMAAIRDDNPVMFFEHKVLYSRKGPVPSEPYTIPLGTCDVKREGSDITIAATGMMVERSLAAAEVLSKEGISAEVIDPRTIVPLDENTIIKSVRKTSRFLVVDEDYARCGVSAELAALVAEKAFDYLDAPVRRLAEPNVPLPFSPILEKSVIPTQEQIVKTAKEMIEGHSA